MNTIARSTTTTAETPRQTVEVPPSTSRTMRAIVQERYGEVDALQLERAERPEIAADEVLVRVHAAGMDRGTWHTMTGRPYLMRILGFGFRGPKNRVLGRDVAGTVVEVGSAVEQSTITEPGLRCALSPSLPRINASTSREPVTQRKTMELRSAISRTDLTSVAPRPTRSSMGARLRCAITTSG